jgi:hypothetical protein
MSFLACIDRNLANGTLTQEKAQEAKDLFGSLYQQYRDSGMTHVQAQTKAAGDSYKALDFKAIERKRRMLITARIYHEIAKDLDKYVGLDGKKDLAKAAEALFTQDDLAPYANIEYSIQAVKGMAMRRMDTFLKKYRRNLIGNVRSKADLKNLVREAFGVKTGDESAAEMATAWKDTAEYLRKRANAAGASIGKLDDYGLPQLHNSVKLREAGMNAWIDEISQYLDFDNMIDQTTGLPFKGGELNTRVMMEEVYQTIITEGYSKINPKQGFKGSFANKRSDHRFLKFKDVEGWIKYQEKYGTGTIFDTMVSHIDAMSRDIAIMERLGPNPRATINYVQNLIKKDAAEVGGKAIQKADRASVNMQTHFNILSGNYTGVTDSDFTLFAAGTRQILQSAQLGSAALAAVTDVNFQRIARQFNGLPQTKLLIDQLQQLSVLTGNERRMTAIRLGIAADEWSTMAAAQARFVGDITGPEVTRRITDFVMRGSLLSPWTFAGKRSFAMEFLGTIADLSNKNLDEVKTANPRFAETLERYGIDKDSWEVIRTTELEEYRGATYFDTSRLENRTDIPQALSTKLATKVLSMINQEGQRAVPSVDVRGRAFLQGDAAGGTVRSEILNSFAMYKSFSVTVFNTHIMRGLKQKSKKRRAQYLVDLIISTTLMGAFAIQLKEMAKGKDPMPMTDASFWGAALLQGGGLAIFGDFLYAANNRYGSNLATTIGGPVAGLLDDFTKLTIGNITELAQGEETKFATELIRFAEKYTPGSSLWYIRLAGQRQIADRLHEWADPEYQRKVRRKERKLLRERGQRYWWSPGDRAPRRAPDLTNILEERD